MSTTITSCSGHTSSTPTNRKPLVCRPDLSSYHTPISTPVLFHGHNTRSCHKGQSIVDITPLEHRNRLDGLIDTFEELNLSELQNDRSTTGRLRSNSVVDITETVTEKSKPATHRRTRSSITPIQSSYLGISTDHDHQSNSTIGAGSTTVSQSSSDQRNVAPQTPTRKAKLLSVKSEPKSGYMSSPPSLKKPTATTSQLVHWKRQANNHDSFKWCVRTPTEKILLDSEDSDESLTDYEDDPLDYDYLDESGVDSVEENVTCDSSATESEDNETRDSIESTKKKTPIRRLNNSASKTARRRSCSPISTPATPTPAGPEMQPQKIGYRGEYYVVKSLADEVPYFDESIHWTSKLRHFANILPYGEKEVTDVQIEDSDGSVSRYLRTRAVNNKIPKWLSDACTSGNVRRPKYFIEVKTTVGDCKDSFFVSKNQYRLMKEKRIRGNGMPEEVYVLIRVFDIDGKPDQRVYIDPWKKMKGGLLEISGYTMTTG